MLAGKKQTIWLFLCLGSTKKSVAAPSDAFFVSRKQSEVCAGFISCFAAIPVEQCVNHITILAGLLFVVVWDEKLILLQLTESLW